MDGDDILSPLTKESSKKVFPRTRSDYEIAGRGDGITTNELKQESIKITKSRRFRRDRGNGQECWRYRPTYRQ